MSADQDYGDPVWARLKDEALREVEQEPTLQDYLQETILNVLTLEKALAEILAGKLTTCGMNRLQTRDLILEAFEKSPHTASQIRNDLRAICDRDPAARGYLLPFVFFKGFQALQTYRVAHYFWTHHRHFLALYFQNRSSEVFAVDIHPAAQIGSGILMDHATGVVIGETCVIEDNVSLLHEVTLGGTGKQTGDRHPKVREGVLLGSGAKVLGNVEIGARAKVGAGSVVLDPVPAHCTVAGVPARIVGRSRGQAPALDMDQDFPHHHEDGSGI